jgi:mRNA interferase MazF
MPHDERLARRSAPRRKGSPKTSLIALRPCKYCATWRRCVRGEFFRLHAARGSRGHEQSDARYAVVLQSDHLPLSTWLVAPTSTSARAASFRPEVEVGGVKTRVLAEQTVAVDPDRLGRSVGFLSVDELRRVDAAPHVVLDL